MKSNIRCLHGVVALLYLVTMVFFFGACVRFPGTADGQNPQQTVENSQNEVPAAEVDTLSGAGPVEKEFYDLLLNKDFGAIEAAAESSRRNRERLPGGTWKIDGIYNGLISFYAEYKGQRITDEKWKNRIELLQQWKAAKPDSITARVVLAKALASYGWFARGNGYINSVSKGNYQTFHTRLEMAERELLDARELSATCPVWYREMMMIGMAQNWPSTDFERLYDEAIATEPNYLQYYLIKSENLTPKWGGEAGAWQRFVDSLPDKLATLETTETDIIYFVVVAAKISDPSLGINWAMISKDRIRKGFQQIEQRYGIDNYRLNQYAFVSFLTQDLESSNAAFERIGNDWNNEVWGQKTFNSIKTAASAGIPKSKR